MSKRNTIVTAKQIALDLSRANLDKIKIESLERRLYILEAEKALLIKLTLRLGGARGSDNTI